MACSIVLFSEPSKFIILAETSKGTVSLRLLSKEFLKLNPVDSIEIVIKSIKHITVIDTKFVLILLLICLVTNIFSFLRYIFLLFLITYNINPANP